MTKPRKRESLASSYKLAQDVKRDWRAALERAMQAHQAGDLDTAEPLYREILEREVVQPDALHYLGVLCHQRGRSEEAVKLITAALVITPKHPDAHNNLGNIHKECGRLAEAEACYRRALECNPRHHNARCNLAVVLEAQERTQEAFEAYGRLLEQAPGYASGHYLLGLFLRNHAQSWEHIEQSVVCFRNAFHYDPTQVRALQALGIGLYFLGRQDEAVAVYKDWLDREPDNPIARHMLAACGASAAPARAGDDYVRAVFDNFADSFDEQLVKNLDYHAPQLIAGALASCLPAPAANLDVLDAGCGTGLCAPLVKPWARRLTGVDLSKGMIAKASKRGSYDKLEVAELTAYLRAHLAAYDAVISADTLVYFGDLADVSEAAHSSLRAGAWLAFTVEALDDEADRVVLSPSGRYQHSRRHVERCLQDARFADIRIESDVLRKEGGQPVAGWVVTARRAVL